VSTTTAPDFRPVARDLPRLSAAPGTRLELLILSASSSGLAGVDLASGALVRAWSAEALQVRMRPYDVAVVTVGDDRDALPDPSQPEALVLAGAPEPRGRLAGRRAERLLRPLLHPPGRPLLELTASTVPFWERRADHPSIGLVEPEGQLSLRRRGSYVACRFGWMGHQRELPCIDRRVVARLERDGLDRLAAPRGARILVSLTPPIEGRCHKVVEAVLARP
jgi:hypothetical protein